MVRKIEAGQKLSKDDKNYLLQRSWLARDLGYSPEDLLGGDVPTAPGVPLQVPQDLQGKPRPLDLRTTPDAAKASADLGDAKSERPRPDPDYRVMKVDQLAAEVKKRGLPTDGNKADLVDRLLADDKKKAADQSGE
jgi:hypothetical protein